MIRIIKGKKYNTDSAQKIESWSTKCSHSDPNYREESLYRKQTGEYFLHVIGENNSRSGNGEKIIPMNFDDAKQWAKEHLDQDFYQKEFCVAPEEDKLILTSVRLPAPLHELLKREAVDHGISLRTLIIDILSQYIDYKEGLNDMDKNIEKKVEETVEKIKSMEAVPESKNIPLSEIRYLAKYKKEHNWLEVIALAYKYGFNEGRNYANEHE